ncbi:unnamed protein product [Amaranthus hypochondriacus]
MEAEHGGVVVKGRAVIDTRPPFRSVKEAVAMFGERVLVGEIYANQLKQLESSKISSAKENVGTKSGNVSTELEETKQNLEKAREEGNYMANWLKSLKEELKETKRELQNLKSKKDYDQQKAIINPEVEEIIKKADNNVDEIEKKRFVTFASPPSLIREINQNTLGRTSSFRKQGKKKPVVAIMGWLFPRKNKTAGC